MKCVKCKKTLPIRHVIFKGQKRNYTPTLKVDGEGPYCKSCAKFIRHLANIGKDVAMEVKEIMSHKRGV